MILMLMTNLRSPQETIDDCAYCNDRFRFLSCSWFMICCDHRFCFTFRRASLLLVRKRKNSSSPWLRFWRSGVMSVIEALVFKNPRSVVQKSNRVSIHWQSTVVFQFVSRTCDNELLITYFFISGVGEGRTMFRKWCALLVLFVGGSVAQCPTLPSGFCFLDCTRIVYRIICENTNGYNLYTDLQMYKNTSQMFELAIWNSKLDRLTSAIISQVSDQITRLEIDNMEALAYFPETKAMTNLTHISIMNSPQLIDIPTQLLPNSLQSLVLHQVGIRELINDFEEVETLPEVTTFSFTNSTLSHIQRRFFSVFPKLKVISLRDVVFTEKRSGFRNFHTESPLDVLELVDNDFSLLDLDTKRDQLENVLGSIKMAPQSTFDFSDNNLPITDGAVRLFERISNVSILSIRSSIFEDYISLTSAFKGFDNLVSLDMTATNMLRSKGAFAGLPKLQELRLANNDLRDLVLVNLFEGCNATNLQLLDLSGNHLRTLPTGLETIAGSIKTLILSNNDINLEQLGNSESSSTTFANFPELRHLILASNHLSSFNSSILQPMTKLEALDLSCNSFVNITGDFFSDLPASINTINMTFCSKTESDAPFFRTDCFTKLTNIQKLILADGFMTSWIFGAFENITLAKLELLDLSKNAISSLPVNTTFKTLASLKILNLNRNYIQSIGAWSMSALTSLQELDLSQNEISALGAHDFEGLGQLRKLSLFGNNIVDVDAGALSPLSKLQAFYFGQNSFGRANLNALLIGNVPQLQHLGLQGLPIDCIDAVLLNNLKKLRWVYLNNSQPLYLDSGSFRNIGEELGKNPPNPFGGHEITMADRGCSAGYITDKSEDRVARFVVDDSQNQVSQHALLSVPLCHSPNGRDLGHLLQNILCDANNVVVTDTKEV